MILPGNYFHNRVGNCMAACFDKKQRKKKKKTFFKKHVPIHIKSCQKRY